MSLSRTEKVSEFAVPLLQVRRPAPTRRRDNIRMNRLYRLVYIQGTVSLRRSVERLSTYFDGLASEIRKLRLLLVI